jgi:hypothetical protein
MQFFIFGVRDLAAQAFMPPSFAHNTGQVVREFRDIVNDANHAFNKHPDDYELYELGVFDDSNGSFTLHPEPKLLVQGKHCLVVA